MRVCMTMRDFIFLFSFLFPPFSIFGLILWRRFDSGCVDQLLALGSGFELDSIHRLSGSFKPLASPNHLRLSVRSSMYILGSEYISLAKFAVCAAEEYKIRRYLMSTSALSTNSLTSHELQLSLPVQSDVNSQFSSQINSQSD